MLGKLLSGQESLSKRMDEYIMKANADMKELSARVSSLEEETSYSSGAIMMASLGISGSFAIFGNWLLSKLGLN